MVVLLDTPQDLKTCEAEIGCEVGQLLTPTTRRILREPDRKWAIDNGAFGDFTEHATSFWSILEREAHHKQQCRFVTVPDVVGSARRTLEVFYLWRERLAQWPVALVCQDGQEQLPIPWELIAAVFIGGSTKWKISEAATHCIKAAQILGKWVHVGRVNDPARFAHFLDLGVDSIDGSGIARYTHMRDAISKRDHQEKLFAG